MTTRPETGRSARGALERAGLGAFAVALAVYLAGAYVSPLLDSERAERAHTLRIMARGVEMDMAREAELARAYWARNPDVRASPVYGEDGRLGVLGAREHYMQHGWREGRAWGP